MCPVHGHEQEACWAFLDSVRTYELHAYTDGDIQAMQICMGSQIMDFTKAKKRRTPQHNIGGVHVPAAVAGWNEYAEQETESYADHLHELDLAVTAEENRRYATSQCKEAGAGLQGQSRKRKFGE